MVALPAVLVLKNWMIKPLLVMAALPAVLVLWKFSKFSLTMAALPPLTVIPVPVKSS